MEKALIFFENRRIALSRMLVGMAGKARSDDLSGGNEHHAVERRVRSHQYDNMAKA